MVNDKSIIEGHVCELSVDFFTVFFSDYVNNTHSFENSHLMPRNIRRQVEITWNAGTLTWLPLTFRDLFSQDMFMQIGTEISSATSCKPQCNTVY